MESMVADLGPMGGTREEVEVLVRNLIATFSTILNSPIQLQEGESGKTDCYSTIWLNLHDPEAYLVAEHELSHWLFGSDPVLASKAIKTIVESRLLLRAGITQPTSDDAAPYVKRLAILIHGIFNILEDHRVAGLWGQLYPGGEALLRERWENMTKKALVAKSRTMFMPYLLCVHWDCAPPDEEVRPEFVACKAPFIRAMRLVEGVDHVSCLGITMRLINEIADELLDLTKPVAKPKPRVPSPSSKAGRGEDTKPSSASDSGKDSETSSRKRSMQEIRDDQKKAARKKKIKKPFQPQQKVDKKEEAEQTLKNLTRLLGRDLSREQDISGMGEKDVLINGEQSASRNDSAHKMHQIRQILRAEDAGTDESGMNPLELMMHQGAEAMQTKIDQAREVLARSNNDPENAQNAIIGAWAKAAGIRKINVRPTASLPPPSEAGFAARREIEKFRMGKKRLPHYNGDLSVPALIDAVGAGKLDRKIYTKDKKFPNFELLVLFDYSGSMLFGSGIAIVELALADMSYALKAVKSKLEIWGYADNLLVFRTVGSLQRAEGMRSGGTNMVEALDAAAMWAKQRPEKRAIMHITDGFPTTTRHQNSAGNPDQDFKQIMEEIREKGSPVTTLVYRHPYLSVVEAEKRYDDLLGRTRYGMVSDAAELRTAMMIAIQELVKGVRK